MAPVKAKCIVLLAIICITSETKPSIKANYAPKIINGDDTTIEKWPFLVQIIYKNSFVCGGSVITNTWVLTAAHCFDDTNPANFKIYADSSIPENGTIYDVNTIKLHENYNETWLVADVALVQIKREFRFSNTLRTIKADFAERQCDTKYKNCSTAGWGRTNATTGSWTLALNLQELDVETVTHAECKVKLRVLRVLRSNVCVKAVKDHASSCHGDSGGPLLCDGVLVGVVSFGNDECTNLVAYAKVASFYTWMNSYMKKFEKKFGRSQG